MKYVVFSCFYFKYGGPATPYPTMVNDWKMAITVRGFSGVKVGILGMCVHSLQNSLQYIFCFENCIPATPENHTVLLQRRIVSIVEEGDKPLLITLL